MVNLKVNSFLRALPVSRPPLLPLVARVRALQQAQGNMFSKAVQGYSSQAAKIQKPLQPNLSAVNSQPAETKKRKFERTISTASNLAALHEAVYFDENDFEDDSKLDFTTNSPLPKSSSVTYPSLDRSLSSTTQLSVPLVETQKHPPSSADVQWSSSPVEHLQIPIKKRGALPWKAKEVEKSETSQALQDEVPKSAFTPASKDKDQMSKYLFKDTTASAIKEQQKAWRQKTRGNRPGQKDNTGVKALVKTSNIKKVPVIFLSDEQKAVLNTVVKDGKSVFFTGSAGTGKSVLMRQIIAKLKDKYSGRDNQGAVAVTASTGLAACNIEGSTVHSFAGIGLGKEDVPQLVRKIRKNPKAMTRWRQTKVLVIDEISMVDGDLYDKLEAIARAIKNNGRPFGGIQLIVTGDFFQLPPVQDSSKPVRFSFDAQTWTTTIQHTILLTHVFRQKDPAFASMLNEMRLGKLTPQSIESFKQLSRALSFDDDIDATELFPTRREVENANSNRMRNLSGQTFTYKAKDIPGKDPFLAQKAFDNMMAPQSLEFKKGAQVMLIKNFDEGLVNGSLGKIQAFMTPDVHSYWKEHEEQFEEVWGDEEDEEKQKKKLEIRASFSSGKKKEGDKPEDLAHYPLVRFSLPDGSSRTMLCTPEEWKVEGNAKDEVVATRVQVPLILAWALSIHKAQGQTLERVKVNLGRAFEFGQAYVALSRATSQAGLQVINFNANKVMVHPKVVGFYQKLVSVHSIPSDAQEPAKKKTITSRTYEKNFVDLTDDPEDDEQYLYE